MAKWEESKHPRDDDGKFTDKGQGTPAERKRLEELNIKDKEKSTIKQSLREEEINNYKKEQIINLIKTLNEVKKIKLKELVNIIKNFDPIELKINDKKILAAFDKYAAEKNLYTRGNSTHKGFSFKLKNINDLPKFIKDSQYYYSKPETGKNTRQHKGVKEWHYFKSNVQVGDEKYNVVINIRDKGNKQYVYEVTFK